MILILVLNYSCSVMLIGEYDAVTDQGIQQVGREVSILLITLKKNLVNNEGKANAYSNFKSSYSAIEGDIETIGIRCSALPKYSLISEQVSTVEKNVRSLEQLHQMGLSAAGDTSIINTIRKTFRVQFQSMVALQNGLKRQKQK